MINRWSKCVPQSAHRPWQWRHGGGQFWGEWRKLRICWVCQKPIHQICQHAGPRGVHQQTGDYVRGLGGKNQLRRPTNGAFLPHQKAWNFGARQRWDRPAQKPPRKWHHSSVSTQTSQLHSTPEDTSVASVKPPPCPCIKARDAALQARVEDLPDVHLLGADYMLYGVYHD